MLGLYKKKASRINIIVIGVFSKFPNGRREFAVGVGIINIFRLPGYVII